MPPPLRTTLVYVAFAVGTLALALGSVWPFVNGWLLRDQPEFVAAREWLLKSDTIGDLVGGHRESESDFFPKGGSDGHTARYEFKISGDLAKHKVGVIVEEIGGAWKVKRAAYIEDGAWVELDLE